MDNAGRAEVTAAAIARLAGVGRAAVSNWRKRYPSFPQPVGGSPASPTFDHAEVLEWLEKTGKASQLAIAGRTDTGTQWIGGPELDASVTVGSNLLAITMVALLPENTGTSRDAMLPVIIDPACARGVLLMAAADRFGDRVYLAGQEINEETAKVAAFNLSSTAREASYEVHAADTLMDDRLARYRGRAAAVICEPPWDRPQWPAGELATDPRWEFGTPAPRDSELAWVQQCYAYLREGGTAVVAVSVRTCVQLSGEHVRAALLRQGVLQAVIALPEGMTGVLPGQQRTCLWVLRRPRDSRPDRDDVRMVDLSGLGDMADVPQDHAAWQRLFDATDPTTNRPVPRLQLLGEGASLLPARYLAPSAQVTAQDINQATKRLALIYSRAAQALPSYQAPGQHPRLSYVTLAELERVGALAIKPRDATPRGGDVLLRTQGRPPVVATGTKADDTGIAQVVEIDESKLDPHFVATFLRSDVAALPVANTLGAINRDDLRRCRIPRMPLAEQHLYGNAFRHVEQLRATMRALADVSEKILDETIYGLTTGALAPEHSPSEGETSEP